MKRQNIRSLTTIGVLGAAGASAFLLPETLEVPSASAAPMPLASDEIRVHGTVRDFKKEHVDFDVTPAGGNGHYAGNLAFTATSDMRPALSSLGAKVTAQWRDMDTNPIPPHLYINSSEAMQVKLVNGPVITNNPTIDTFDSTLGPYGPTNKGPAPTFVPGSAMPTVSEPTGMPALVTEWIRDGNGTTVISADINCNKFLLRNQHIAQISGTRRIVAHEELTIENFAKVQLLAGASLTVYVKKDATIKNNIDFNLNTSDPSRLVVYNLGTLNFTIENSSATYMHLIAPNGGLHIKNSGQLAGQYMGKNITLDNSAGFHLDTEGAGKVCGVMANDTAGTKTGSSTGGITSAASFTEWYRDTLGANLSAQHTITLVKNSSGVYEYLDNAFFPIDGRLFGNEDDAHNYFFTFTFSVPFVHDSCASKFFEFEGADDAWLFVEEDLAMDLGGILPGTRQYVPMDRMDLVDGQTYTLRLFYAQRNPTSAVFRVRTNLDLVQEDSDGVASAGWD